jgi:hypothetical protein
MSTRAEQARDDEQRKRSAAARKRARAKAASGTTKPSGDGTRVSGAKSEKKGVAAKATYAYEAPRAGKHSRKSTRKSANRVKPDSGMTLREGLRKGSPESRAAKSRARATHPRGSSARG